MPATLTRAPNITGLIAGYAPPGPQPSQTSANTASTQPPFAVRNHDWLARTWKLDAAAHPAHVEQERNCRWEEVLVDLRAHPLYQRAQAVPVRMPRHIAPMRAPVAVAVAARALYPALPAQGITGLYPELAGLECDATLPRPAGHGCCDAKGTQASRGFKYVDRLQHAPSAPRAGLATLQQLQPVH